jgi:hypothetical protein
MNAAVCQRLCVASASMVRDRDTQRSPHTGGYMGSQGMQRPMLWVRCACPRPREAVSLADLLADLLAVAT